MKVPVGATSYVFRYLLHDASRAPQPDNLLVLARNAGLDALQICENARPLRMSAEEWADLARHASELGLRISLGCMTLEERTVIEYLDRVEAIGGDYLRIVLERDGTPRLTVGRIRQFLDAIRPHLEARKIRLAIENHFDIPSKILAEAATAYPPELVGFCVDVANSLRNFEDTDAVLESLGARAVCYHLKDYVVSGSNVGFTVSGAPFGNGRIDALPLLRRITREGEAAPEIFLETWTPTSGNWEHDVQEDAKWLAESIDAFKTCCLQVQAHGGAARANEAERVCH